MSHRSGFALATVLLAGAAHAHHLAAPKVDFVHVSRAEVRVMVDYAVDPARAGELRANFDRDRDGTLGTTEREAAEAWLRTAATHFLAVAIDGTQAVLRETEAEFRGLDGRGDPGAMVVLSAPLALGAGPHTLLLTDRHKDDGIPVPVRVTFARGLECAAPDTPQVLGPQTRSLAIDFHAQ